MRTLYSSNAAQQSSELQSLGKNQQTLAVILEQLTNVLLPIRVAIMMPY